jgi:hypothetical protein
VGNFFTGCIRAAGDVYNVVQRRQAITTFDPETVIAVGLLRYRRHRRMYTTLSELLTKFRRCNTVKERDRVYTFLGICDQEEMLQNRVDYGRGIVNIFFGEYAACRLLLAG